MALPPISGQPAPRLQPANDARAAAQRAFFEAALGRAPAAPPPARPAATAAAPPVRTTATPAAAVQEAGDGRRPDANARPGSIVNIRV